VPGFEVEVEALNVDPTPIENVTVPEIIDSLETLIGETCPCSPRHMDR
jgi:hypothetical protein